MGRKLGNPSLPGRNISWICLDIVGGEEFQDVVSEVREPCILFAGKPGAGQLILVALPTDVSVLQPLWKRLPPHPAVVNFLIAHVDLRIRALLVADGPSPEVAAVGR